MHISIRLQATSFWLAFHTAKSLLHQKYLLQHSVITNSLINEGISLLTKEDSIETARKMNQWYNNLYLLTTTSNHIRLLIIISIIIVVTIIDNRQ